MKSTNYQNTFIAVAQDCSRAVGTIPPSRMTPTIAALQHEMISKNPYKFTSDDLLFQVHCERNGQTTIQEFFNKGQACLRCSPLTQSYGWGLHFDCDGKIAIYGIETNEYSKFMSDESLKHRFAYVSRRVG